jgi:predicted phosphodiesterase
MIEENVRIAAISDIHGNLAALDAVLADIQRRGISLVVNLGDILSGALFPRETADRLMPLALPTIRGNQRSGGAEGNFCDARLAEKSYQKNNSGW